MTVPLRRDARRLLEQALTEEQAFAAWQQQGAVGRSGAFARRAPGRLKPLVDFDRSWPKWPWSAWGATWTRRTGLRLGTECISIQ